MQKADFMFNFIRLCATSVHIHVSSHYCNSHNIFWRLHLYSGLCMTPDSMSIFLIYCALMFPLSCRVFVSLSFTCTQLPEFLSLWILHDTFQVQLIGCFWLFTECDVILVITLFTIYNGSVALGELSQNRFLQLHFQWLWREYITPGYYWVFGLCPLPRILKNIKEYNISKLAVWFHRWGGGRHLFCSVHWIKLTSIYGPPNLKTETIELLKLRVL
jgi:hypothetical protein